jgi:hypothetical protein
MEIYRMHAKPVSATAFFFFFLAFCHHQPFHPIEFYFRSWTAA